MNSRVSVIETYGHNGKVGVLVELELKTTFTAQTPEFKELAREIAVQIAAMDPSSLSALLHSESVRDSKASVGARLHEVSKTLGEKISISRFVRWDNEHDA
jgi:elongation factor Ts